MSRFYDRATTKHHIPKAPKEAAEKNHNAAFCEVCGKPIQRDLNAGNPILGTQIERYYTMAFNATRIASGQYVLRNDVTGEHMTVDSADEIKAAIDLYNQGVTDKANADAAAAAAALAPVPVPVVDVPGSEIGTVPGTVSIPGVNPLSPAPTVAELEAQLAAAKAQEAAAVTDLTGLTPNPPFIPTGAPTPGPVTNVN